MTEREERLEKMIQDTRKLYEDTQKKLEEQRARSAKPTSVRYRELMMHRQQYQTILSMFQSYGLIDSF